MSPEAPAPGGQYSQAIVSNGFLFTAGIRPQDPATGEIPEHWRADDGIVAQYPGNPARCRSWHG